MKPRWDNPWNLTPAQSRTIAAIAEHGTSKLAAKALGLAPFTVDNYVDEAMTRMDTTCRAQATAKWAMYESSRKLEADAILCFNLGRAIGRGA